MPVPVVDLRRLLQYRGAPPPVRRPAVIFEASGQRIALLTDGRMSGASGKVLAAIHVTPEAADGGALAKLREGDTIRIDAEAGTMDALVDAAEWNAREAVLPDLSGNQFGTGRELFGLMRGSVGSAEQGACSLFGNGA